jgi:WD40 repeat protein
MTLSNLCEPEQQLEDVILSYLKVVDAGQAVDRQEFLDHHLQFQTELNTFFADQDQMASVIEPFRNLGPTGPALPKGSSFGDYEVLEEIARGGMGVVFKARQISLNRLVGLKMILAGHLASPLDVQRFQTEAEACAHLDHPRIVPIYEIGEYQSQHYFSMKLMEGGSLAGQIENGSWRPGGREPQRRAARLLATVARAVEHAHERGILHRDLKPGNILFDLQGEPHVSDFGLSKRLHRGAEGDHAQRTSLTNSGAIVGTLAYMAPGQATLQPTLTTAADVYSLGAVLYELLTGRPPFRADTPGEIWHQVTHAQPSPPRQLNPTVNRDLETIVLKCLEKDPRCRYSRAAALAEDLERWLAGEPICARPAGVFERAAKFARRRPTFAAMSFLLAASMLLGVAALAWSWQTAQTAQHAEKIRGDQEAREKRRLALKLYFKNIALARLEFAENNIGRANELLRECETGLRGWEWHFLDRYFHPELRTLRTHSCGVVSLAFSADGQRLASVSSNVLDRQRYDGHSHQGISSASAGHGSLRIFRAADGRELVHFDHKADPIFRLTVSPDGKSIACAGGKLYEPGYVKVFDTASGHELLNLTGHKGTVRGVAYSPDGRRIASASDDGTVKVWDAKSGEILKTIADRDSSITAIHDVTFSPDGTRLAGATLNRTAKIWDTTTGRELLALQGHAGNVTRVVFSLDGQRVATASEDHTVKIWKGDTGQELLTLAGHTDGVSCVTFSSDGRRLVSTSYDNTVRVWDSTTGLPFFTLVGHDAAVMDAACSPDGQHLATASLDGSIKVWKVQGSHAVEALQLAGRIARLTYSPDGLRLAGGGWTDPGDVAILDAVTGKQMQILKGHKKQIEALAYAPDGKRLATLSLDKTARVWDVATGQSLFTLQCGGAPTGYVVPMSLVYSPDGKRLATAASDEPIRVWDSAGRELHAGYPPAAHLAFSPDGKLLASAGSKGINVRDPVSGKELYTVNGSYEFVVFSPDGARLIAIGEGGVKFLEVADGHEVMTLSCRVRADLACLSPDGRRLALVGDRNTIRLWDTSSGEETLALPGHTSALVSLAFSPDGNRLTSVDVNHIMRFWDATPLRHRE